MKRIPVEPREPTRGSGWAFVGGAAEQGGTAAAWESAGRLMSDEQA
jgi:hypothetical protein